MRKEKVPLSSGFFNDSIKPLLGLLTQLQETFKDFSGDIADEIKLTLVQTLTTVSQFKSSRDEGLCALEQGISCKDLFEMFSNEIIPRS